MILDKLIIAARLCLLAVFLVATGNSIALFGSLPYLWLIFPVLGASSPCSDCIGGTQNTTSIQVDFSGVANNLCTCCTNLNATFILNFTSVCSYTYSTATFNLCGFFGSCAGAGIESIGVSFSWNAIGTDARVEILDGSGGGGQIDGFPGISYPRDCSSASGLSGIPMTVTVGSGAPTSTLRCDYTAATATVTP